MTGMMEKVPQIKLSAPVKVYDFVADWYFGFFRVNCFALASCFDWANKSWLIKNHYEGFNVKDFARPFEKIPGYILAFCGLVVVSSGIIVPFLSLLGYI